LIGRMDLSIVAKGNLVLEVLKTRQKVMAQV
jgi:hypothetical protein